MVIQEFITNSHGTKIGLHRVPAVDVCVGTVILAHGTFSNYRSCRGLAKHLSVRGFDCWLLDFQGHGISAVPDVEPDFETMCLQDTGAAIKHVQAASADGKVWWVGHSGGGLAILMYLARNPLQQQLVHGLVMLASQATDAAISRRNRLLIYAAAMATSVLRVAPGKYLGIGPENEFAAVMMQWYRWSLAGNWRGKDGFDYLAALASVTVPSCTFSAAADHFIAPPSGCKKLHELLGGSDKIYRLCGRQSGDSEDYTHPRIVSSRSAAVDIWPRVADWLISRRTAVPDKHD